VTEKPNNEKDSGYKQSDEEKSVVKTQKQIDDANAADVKRTQEEASSGS